MIDVTVVTVSPNRFCLGNYVFASRYKDADPNDPWVVGFIDEIGVDHKGGFIRIYEQGMRTWRYAAKIDKEDGKRLIRNIISPKR